MARARRPEFRDDQRASPRQIQLAFFEPPLRVTNPVAMAQGSRCSVLLGECHKERLERRRGVGFDMNREQSLAAVRVADVDTHAGNCFALLHADSSRAIHGLTPTRRGNRCFGLADPMAVEREVSQNLLCTCSRRKRKNQPGDKERTHISPLLA